MQKCVTFRYLFFLRVHIDKYEDEDIINVQKLYVTAVGT